MKKCPFCAEEIHDQSAICRFCGREITADSRKDDRAPCPHCSEWIRKDAKICRFCQREVNPEDKHTKDSLTQVKSWKKAEDLTLDDIGLLLESWATSYSNTPPAIGEKVKSSLSYLTSYLAEVSGKLLRHKLIREREMQTVMSQALAFGYQWGFACYAIGLEGALGNIDDKNVPFYLFACENPFSAYLLGFLGVLIKNKKVKEEYVRKLGTDLGSYLSKTSVFLANQGFVYHKSVTPKYEGRKSPLAIHLLSIDISGIKETKERG